MKSRCAASTRKKWAEAKPSCTIQKPAPTTPPPTRAPTAPPHPSRLLLDSFRLLRTRFCAETQHGTARAASGLIDEAISRQRQEFLEIRTGHHLPENLRRLSELRTSIPTLGKLFIHHRVHHRRRHRSSIVELRSELHPLPHLRAANLGRGRVFHQVVNRHAANPAQPGFEILQAHIDIPAQPRLGNGPLGSS